MTIKEYKQISSYHIGKRATLTQYTIDGRPKLISCTIIGCHEGRVALRDNEQDIRLFADYRDVTINN